MTTRWAIAHTSQMAAPTWTGPLSFGWMDPKGEDHPYTHRWPATFRTRREARAMAARLTAKYAYVNMGWRFKAIHVRIVVQVVASSRAPKVARKTAGSSRRRKG